jgi:hypothetical protein
LSESNRRYFKAVRLKGPDGKSTGIGIIEYTHGHQTLELASLYYDEALSHKQSFDAIAIYVRNRLAAVEHAKLRFSNVKIRRSYCEPFNQVIKFAFVRPGAHMNEPLMLAEDALHRKTSIREILEKE